MNETINILQKELGQLTAADGLKYIANQFEKEAAFSTSFGIEDQVITHLIANSRLPITVFTLDTGRLFPETYSTWNSTIEKYRIEIDAYFPATAVIEQLIKTKGPNSFYESVDNRKECCAIRKVEPLQRALKGKKIWITGIRAEQSSNRELESMVEWDAANNIIKYHPLLFWTFEEVKDFVSRHGIPVNPLFQKGFVSIGCAPCTRAIKAGENFRAGRWWWEEAGKKECGLHVHA
jgi:phosphoadenosine phosphosulfate reductase